MRLPSVDGLHDISGGQFAERRAGEQRVLHCVLPGDVQHGREAARFQGAQRQAGGGLPFRVPPARQPAGASLTDFGGAGDCFFYAGQQTDHICGRDGAQRRIFAQQGDAQFRHIFLS